MTTGHLIALSLATALLTACAQPSYVYNGKLYTDGEQMKRDMKAVDDAYLAQLKPLAQPVTRRELKVFVPDRTYFMNTKLAYTRATAPMATMDVIENNYLITTTYNAYVDLHRYIDKKGIYPRVTQSFAADASGIQPTDDYDALVLATATQPGMIDQWYHVSQRNGKRTIHFDTNLPTIYARYDSQLDSIKAAAMQ